MKDDRYLNEFHRKQSELGIEMRKRRRPFMSSSEFTAQVDMLRRGRQEREQREAASIDESGNAKK